MAYDVVSTMRASEILGCNRSRVLQMIREGIITTAYIGAPDGNPGRTGYRIRVDELYDLAATRDEKKTRKQTKNKTVPAYDTVAIKSALSDLQICLGMLSDAIEKLKGEL